MFCSNYSGSNYITLFWAVTSRSEATKINTVLLCNEDIQTSLERNLKQGSHIHFYTHIFFHIYSLIIWQLSVDVNIALKWYQDSIQVAQVVQLLQDGRAICSHLKVCCISFIQGVPNRAIEGHEHTSRSSIYSVVWERRAGALLQPKQPTSRKLLLYMLLTRMSESDSIRVAQELEITLWDLCSHHSYHMWGSSFMFQRTPDLASPLLVPCSQMRVGSVSSCDRHETVSMVKVMLPVTIQHYWFGVGQWWFWEAYPWNIIDLQFILNNLHQWLRQKFTTVVLVFFLRWSFSEF